MFGFHQRRLHANCYLQGLPSIQIGRKSLIFLIIERVATTSRSQVEMVGEHEIAESFVTNAIYRNMETSA